MAGPGIGDVAGDEDVASVDDDGGVDDDAGEVVGASGSMTAAVEFDKALLSGLCADKKARAAVHSATAPMAAAESHFLADLALGAAAACGLAEARPSSHVTTR